MRLLLRRLWPVIMGSISILSRAEPAPAQDEEAAAMCLPMSVGVELTGGTVETGDEASAESIPLALEVAIGGREGREGREDEGAGDEVVEVGILSVQS